ncbi:MAG: response regulator [Candidatus Handelsmanbacteria bacterium]|nr:response regulator [Candidatus Handelsmanbacteria bacterium]
MERQSFLTTGEVASHCEVAVKTVNNWIEAGKLRAATTPGRHHRIQIDDFRSFLKAHQLPAFGDEQPGKCRVLVVDDDAGIVTVLSRGLRKTGRYEVATAADGFEAGIQVTTFAPDLIVLDLFMPNLDGFRVCEWVRGNPASERTRILVLTGDPAIENLDRALKSGADRCLAKPVTVREVEEQIQQLLSEVRTSTKRA